MSIILARVIDFDVAKYIVNIANKLWIEDKKELYKYKLQLFGKLV